MPLLVASGTHIAAIVGIIATLAASGVGGAITYAVYRANQLRVRQQHLEALWAQILYFTQEHPELCDISRTMNYLVQMPWNERLSYDALCLDAWSIIYDAAVGRSLGKGRMRLALEWVAAFHSEWLLNNAQLFASQRFWSAFEEVQGRESRLTRHRPAFADAANWDEEADRYFQRVFSPFDPDLPTDNPLRRELLQCITEYSSAAAADIHIVDLGCGPGFLLQMIEMLPNHDRIQYTGIDRATRVIQFARERTAGSGVKQTFVVDDMTHEPERYRGDVVVCINAILGGSRAENRQLLAAVTQHLRTDGSVALLVLPAFEVAEHLLTLRHAAYLHEYGPEFADRVIAAYRRWKSPNQAQASYSDDGVLTQYFHSIDTMASELPAAGLEVVRGPLRLEYPWEQARRFDYGYFPGETPPWDWLVVCRRAAP